MKVNLDLFYFGLGFSFRRNEKPGEASAHPRITKWLPSGNGDSRLLVSIFGIEQLLRYLSFFFHADII